MRPTLATFAKRCLTREIQLERGARVLAAVSGGPDSMALLHVLARLRAPLGFELVAHGVDHGLREDAAAELDLARALADALGVPFGTTRVRVSKGGNLQARAREARWGALESAASKHACALVATAHHADDRAETVLLRILRGAGPAELGVLEPREENRARPFVRARRADVLAHLERHRVSCARDPSNEDPRFLRARVRTELLPLLERLSPTVVEHLCALADQAAAIGRGEGAHIYPLPRATQRALADLVRNPNARARILLPGGLVAARDQPQVPPEVEAPGFRDTNLKSRTSRSVPRRRR